MSRLSPRLLAFLKALEVRPRPRPKGTIVGPTARRAGYTDDEVFFDGRRMALSEARSLKGPEWFLSTQFTGNEVITEAGREALARHRESSLR